MIKVKVCGIRDYRNMQEVAKAGADYLGFIFYAQSKRYIGDNPDMTLFQQVPAGIMKVGVFVDEKPDSMLELASRYALNLLQLHGSESIQNCRTIRSAGYKVIKAFGVDNVFDFTSLLPYIPVCDYFLFDTKSALHGGTGKKFNWENLQHYGYDIPFFLSGGIGFDDALAIRCIDNPALYAVDINSRFEVEPGIKNVNQVTTFIEEIKTVIL